MTKLKSKKMTKSTFAIIIMAVVMVAMLAFGGTYAYFTATAKADSAELQTGYVKLEANGALTALNLSNVMPTQDIVDAGAIKLKVTTTEEGNYVAVKFTITAKDAAGDDIEDISTIGLNVATALGNAWGTTTEDNVYIYGTSAAPTKATGDIVVNANKITFDATDNWTQGEDGLNETSDAKLMGATITITMQAYSIQSTGTTADLVEALLAKF